MFKKAVVKALVVLIPTYIVAYLTEMMVYTIPMLAASSIFATSMFDKNRMSSELMRMVHQMMVVILKMTELTLQLLVLRAEFT